MKGLAKPILIAVVIAMLSEWAFGEVQVVARVDTSEDIYVGQSFAYRIIIDGEEKPGEVDLTPLADYNPQSLGGGPASQTSISIINGRTTRTVIKRYVMNYTLTVTRPGRIQLPGLAVTLDGRSYQTNAIVVNILKPGTTDRLDLEVTLSEQKCYVGQPVILTVKFFISADIGDFNFNIPALTGDDFHLEDPDIADPQARQYRLNTGTTAFVSQQRTVHKGRDAVLLSFSKVLIPKRAGEIQLGSSSVSANVAVGQARSGDPFFDGFGMLGTRKQYKRFMVTSSPLSLTVLALPDAGRPAEFYGLVGRYTISASAAPTKVNVGDPITLTIRIGGEKYLKPVQWPDLEKVGALAASFKMPSQRATPLIEDGVKVFTQTIRANSDKVTEIPSIPLAFFDAEEGRYLVAETEPIRLEVAPTKILTNADLEGAGAGPVNREVEAVKKGLSENYEGADVLRNMSFSPVAAALSPGYAVLWSVPLLGLAASSVIRLLTHTSPEKVRQRRRRQSRGNALRRLRKIAVAPAKQRDELLVSAMKQYIGDRFDRVPGSLTADDCNKLILTATEDEALAARYGEIITACEASRYAPSQGGHDAGRAEEAVKLVRLIEKKAT